MEYVKVPYVALKGKKHTEVNFSPSEQSKIVEMIYNKIDESTSTIYGISFQDLLKQYQSGEDPAEDAIGVIDTIADPEKMLNLHKAISVIAKKYNYTEQPDISRLYGVADKDVYGKIKLMEPNSYLVANKGKDEGTALVIVDKDSSIKTILLPWSEDYEYKSNTISFNFITADENGNVLIPKEAIDRDLESF